MAIFNSKEYSWQDMKVLNNGVTVAGIKSITYKVSQDKQPIHGQGSKPHSIQRGVKSYEGELVVYQSELEAMNQSAKAAGHDDLMDVAWTFVISYSNDTKISIDTLVGVEFSEYDKGLGNEDLNSEHTLPFIYLGMTSK